jgi:C_GCAxxG_C_C family probable redox protein
MTKSEKAVELSNKNFNCSQSVFSVFAEENGLNEKTALRIACAFGGGLARTAGVCGAVTGAMMAIGLKHGMDDPEKQEVKAKTYEITRKFFDEFTALHGSLICKDLIGFDIGNPEKIGITGNSPEWRAKMKKTHDEICSKLIADAVKIVEKLI